MCLALLVYYLVPLIRYDRGEHAPNQAVLIDMVHARAYFFGIEIWPQEVYYLTAILIVAAIALFLVTSLLGGFGAVIFVFRQFGQIYLFLLKDGCKGIVMQECVWIMGRGISKKYGKNY